MNTPAPRDCEHGQLARSCRICELEAERDEKDRQLTSCYDRMDRAERALAEARAKERELTESIGAAKFEFGDRFAELPDWFHEIWNRRVEHTLAANLTDEAKP